MHATLDMGGWCRGATARAQPRMLALPPATSGLGGSYQRLFGVRWLVYRGQDMVIYHSHIHLQQCLPFLSAVRCYSLFPCPPLPVLFSLPPLSPHSAR